MKWQAWLSLALCVPIACLADADTDALVARMRAKVVDDAKKLPRYMCRQNIERRAFITRSPAPKNCAEVIEQRTREKERGLRLGSLDRARLDVMLSASGEMFSWPGEHTFEARDPWDLLGSGLTGTGDFGPFLLDIFGDPRIQFRYQAACGRKCARFTYQVPQSISHYALKTNLGSTIVAYSGEFDVDMNTAELLRLTIVNGGLGTIQDVCQVETEITYRHIQQESSAHMLPASTEKRAIFQNGEYFINRVSYDECQEYGAESVLKFDDPAEAAVTVAKTDAPPRLPPPGTVLELRLVTKIDTNSSAAGDGVTAAVTKPVLDASGGLVVPAGTIVRGHVTQLLRYYLPVDKVLVGIRFGRIVLGGSEVSLPLAAEGFSNRLGIGTFTFREGRVVLSNKFVSRWVVADPLATNSASSK